MAKKAGFLAVGGEAAAAAARRGEASLIITASDASAGSIRRAKANAESNGVKHLAVPHTMFELGSTAGRGSPGTIAFLDKGLADGFTDRINEAKKVNSAEDGASDKKADGVSDKPAGAKKVKEGDA